MTSAKRSLSPVEWTLLLHGLLLVGVYGLYCLRSSLYQTAAREGFDQLRSSLSSPGPGPGELFHEWTAPTVLGPANPAAQAPPNIWEWSTERIRAFASALLAKGPDPIARLRIPAVGLDVMVLEGTDESVLSRAVGHLEGTSSPGDDGNIAIAGHRDGFFRVLSRVSKGDIITLVTAKESIDYVVEDLRVVEPSAVEVLDPTSRSTLTLITCYPFYYVGSAPMRFIVRAAAPPVRPVQPPWRGVQLAALGPRNF